MISVKSQNRSFIACLSSRAGLIFRTIDIRITDLRIVDLCIKRAFGPYR